MQINGTVALVSGGGSGLGAATARYLASNGAKIAVLDREFDQAQEVASDVSGLALEADVTVAESVEAAVARISSHFGAPARIVVNCAGIAPAARVVNREGAVSVDLFAKVCQVNLIGSYTVLSYAAAAIMAEPTDGEEQGVVINTSSAAWQDGQVGQAAYAASKGGVAAMSLPIAREFAKSGIRVAAIAPGLFHTPMMEGLPEEVTDKIKANIPFPARLGDPSEFALMVGQIVTNPYLNGTTLRLDGAVRLPPR